MALSVPFAGTGRFVPEREWSCSQHDNPQDHECDCEFCSLIWLCDECANSTWVDVFDADGKTVMREVGAMEEMLSQWAVEMITAPCPLFDELLRGESG